jgi:hypothetical protein
MSYKNVRRFSIIGMAKNSEVYVRHFYSVNSFNYSHRWTVTQTLILIGSLPRHPALYQTKKYTEWCFGPR